MKTIGWVACMAWIALPAHSEMGMAAVKGTSSDSNIGGTLLFQDTRDGLRISGKLHGLPPGAHGFHIHEFGRCDDSGNAAGSHFNPKGSPHGFLPKDGLHGAHGGDLGNITAGADGAAEVDFLLRKISLVKGRNTVAGRAVVIHQKADDFSQPAGNAGSRIACGPILISGQ